MKLLSYNYRGLERVGIYVGDRIAHLSRLAGILGKKELAFGSMIELIKAWETHGPALHELVARAEENEKDLAPILMAPEDVHHISPIPHPPKHVLCMGLNYQDHVNEGLQAKDVQTTRVELDHPIFFTKAQGTLIGHNEGIPAHRVTEKLDYEAEIAVIIGKEGKIFPRMKLMNTFSVIAVQTTSPQGIFKGAISRYSRAKPSMAHVHLDHTSFPKKTMAIR